MRAGWLSAPAFAAIARITPRSARRILERAHCGHPWRGHHLEVRRVRARGGNAGMAYEVQADSLPAALREAVLARPPASVAPAEPATASPPAPAATERVLAMIDKPSPVARWRYSVIEPALWHPPRSRERKQAVEEASRAVRDRPSGKRGRVSVRSIERWIAAYGRDGMAGLHPKPPANRGQDRVFIGRAWDAAVPFDDEIKERIVESVSRDIRSLWAANTTCGWRHIARLAAGILAKETVAAGFDPGTRRLRTICRLPRRIVERGRRYRLIAIHDKDRKRWVDENVPRVSRTRKGRRPMEIVIGDVHHLDMLLRREDGSTYTPKLIAWHDWATNRVFGYPVFLQKGKGVRQEHVIEAFITMVTDPRWGMPDNLYLDNGGEYNWAELIDDAMKLSSRMRFLDDDKDFASRVRARRSAIIKALPYNAPAKAIEGVFANLEGSVFSMFPGWIGGNRMKKKTANVGKEPAPYPGDEAAFRRSLSVALDWYDTHPQEGFLGGLSPREAFAAFVEDGWRRTDIDPEVLRWIFSRPVARRIWQSQFSLDGVSYTAPELAQLLGGTRVIVRVPLIGGRQQLPVLDERENPICMAACKSVYDTLDREGARVAAKGRRAAEAGIRVMRRETDPVDAETRMAEVLSGEELAPIPERGNIIRMGETLEKIARASERSPAESHTIETANAAREERRREKTRHAQDEFLRAVDGSTPHCVASPESGGMSDEQRQAIDALLQRRRASG